MDQKQLTEYYDNLIKKCFDKNFMLEHMVICIDANRDTIDSMNKSRNLKGDSYEQLEIMSIDSLNYLLEYFKESLIRVDGIAKLIEGLNLSMKETVFQNINDEVTEEDMEKRFFGIKLALSIFEKELDTIL